MTGFCRPGERARWMKSIWWFNAIWTRFPKVYSSDINGTLYTYYN